MNYNIKYNWLKKQTFLKLYFTTKQNGHLCYLISPFSLSSPDTSYIHIPPSGRWFDRSSMCTQVALKSSLTTESVYTWSKGLHKIHVYEIIGELYNFIFVKCTSLYTYQSKVWNKCESISFLYFLYHVHVNKNLYEM